MKHLPIVLAAALVAYTFLPAREPAKQPARGEVATALASASKADRQYVADMYRALADITQRDGGRLIATTGVWRLIHRDTLAFGVADTQLKGKYPGLDVAIESTLAQYFAKTDVPLTPELAAKIVQGCKAVEVQCRTN
jgi:hypothetical protein